MGRSYTAREIDAIAAYSADLERCYLLPVALAEGRSSVRLRVGPGRNGQQLKVNWAKDFDLAARLGAFGAVAQLGERRAGSAEVRGSIPLGSIPSRNTTTPRLRSVVSCRIAG